MPHPLLDVMLRAALGDFPLVDGGVTFLPDLDDGNRAIVSFTGHAYIAADIDPNAFAGIDLDGLGAALSPHAVLRVADGGLIGVIDVTLAAVGVGGGASIEVTDRWDEHDRVRHARNVRRDVVVQGDEHGFFTLADGLAGRRELSIEVADPGRRPGLGRHLLAEARRAIDPGELLFAAVAPGNARSLRSFLASGFVPIGSEVVIDRASRRTQ